MQADLEKAKFISSGDDNFEESPKNSIPAWKIFIIAAAILALVSTGLWLLGCPRIAGTLFGTGMILLVFFAAFRNVPTLRKKAGNGGNIDFGTR